MGTTFSISHRKAHGLRRTLIPILVALSLLASQLPFLGAGTAEAAIGPWSIDGIVPDSTPSMQTLTDPCNSSSDDKPINGNNYKLNNIQDAGTPVFETGNVTGKSDLCNIWVDLATQGDDVLLYFAWQRFAPQGAVNVSLELQKGSLTPACTGTPDFFNAGGCNPFANRQVGDLLLTFDFDPVPAMYLRSWTGSDWSGATELNGNKAIAAVDGGKNDTLRGEAAINLTTSGILPGVGQECVTFATVLPFSQTGNSTSAELQDVVLNGFPGPSISNCGQLVVQKVTSPIGLSGPFPVELKKGASTLASFDLAAHGSSFVYGDTDDEPLFAGSDYSLTETVPTGWDADYSVTCTIGAANAIDGDGNITVAANSTTTCTITNTAIAPKITLVKTVNNQFGGTATQDDFQAKLDGTNVGWDTAIETTIGSHTASEVMNVSGYTAGDWGGDCAANGSITVGPGDEATCTITNSDVQPTLTLEKIVDNSAGGTATQDDFQARIDGADVDWDTAVGLNAGSHTASESTLPGYAAGSWGGDCAANGAVSLTVGQNATCVITNTAIAPTLTVVKEVVNDSGGTLGPDDFPLYLNGASVQHDDPNDVVAGVEYTVSEDQQPGYAQTGLVCEDDDTGVDVGHPVTLDLAQSVTCTITNDDVMPGLTVVKSVINDDGGALGPDDFQLRVNGGPIAHGVALANPQAGVEYDVTEDDPTDLGYAYVSTVCVDAGTQEEVANPVTLALGQAVVCTITNDDIAPTVTVIKEVINDDGGTAGIADFTLYLGEDEVTSGASSTVTAGVEYTVSEDLVDGYEQVSLTCTDADENDLGATFTPELAQDITCVIVNDDIAPTVTVTKLVINDDGGNAGPADFTLLINADEVVSGESNDVVAGTEYTVSEELLDGYEQIAFSCTDSDENSLDATFTPELAQHISCVIINDDLPSGITLTKDAVIDADADGQRVVEVLDGATTTITYRFVATNTGQTTLTDLVLVDDKIGPVMLAVDTLQPGESTEAFADYTITAADIAAGRVDNVGTVTGTDPFGNERDAEDDETVSIVEVLSAQPGIGLVKEALVDADEDGLQVVEHTDGEDTVVRYRFTISNTGNTTLTDIALVDDKIGPIDVPAGTTLEPGESTVVEADYTLTAADVAAGEVENLGIATGTDPSGTEVSAEDTASVDIVEVLVVEVKPAVLQRTLPRTGVEGERLVALGVLLASLGAAALLLTPRRRRSA
ncbi:DUF7507 domain-containing protein [Nitriliruptor alkaliphilus]|uniref:DUF7507 domain-containing protein n=1 Tax=Nitriliruptor alkaliphilus TaxID=427918 RepID=UPI00069669F7|nr:hypothetical protein [Nitriliruptor alkaliphilus]